MEQLCSHLYHDCAETDVLAAKAIHHLLLNDPERTSTIVEPLVEGLPDDRIDVRRTFVNVLSQIAGDASAALGQFAGSVAQAIPESTDESAERLERVLCYATKDDSEASVEAVETLAGYTDHGDWAVRHRAIRAIWALERQDCRSTRDRKAPGPNPKLCEAAVVPLDDALVDDRAEIREKAAKGLRIAARVVPEAASHTAARLGDTVANDDALGVRAASAAPLGELVGRSDTLAADGVDRLIDALNDESREVRDAAAGALCVIARQDPSKIPSGSETFREALSDDSCRMRWRIAQMMGYLGAEDPDAVTDSIPQLVDMLEMNDPPCEPVEGRSNHTVGRQDVRTAAARALGQIGRVRPTAVTAAISALEVARAERGKPSWDARRALEKIHEADPSVVPASMLKSDSDDDDDDPQLGNLFG